MVALERAAEHELVLGRVGDANFDTTPRGSNVIAAGADDGVVCRRFPPGPRQSEGVFRG